jgi:hypothetical protein
VSATCWIAEAYWRGIAEPQDKAAAKTQADLADWKIAKEAQGFQVRLRQGSGSECAGVPD